MSEFVQGVIAGALLVVVCWFMKSCWFARRTELLWQLHYSVRKVVNKRFMNQDDMESLRSLLDEISSRKNDDRTL